MINTNIRPATIEDARYIGRNLRPGDFNELMAYGEEVHPKILVIESFYESSWSRVATLDDVPVIIYGVFEDEKPSIGILWMVATPEIYKFTRKFIKGCYQEVADMQAVYPKLYNYVHKDNHISKKWLKWLGFEIDESTESAIVDFQYFSKGNLCAD